MDKKGCQFFLCDDLLVNKVNNLEQANKQTTTKKKNRVRLLFAFSYLLLGGMDPLLMY